MMVNIEEIGDGPFPKQQSPQLQINAFIGTKWEKTKHDRTKGKIDGITWGPSSM
jgi:hypothetical protein